MEEWRKREESCTNGQLWGTIILLFDEFHVQSILPPQQPIWVAAVQPQICASFWHRAALLCAPFFCRSAYVDSYCCAISHFVCSQRG